MDVQLPRATATADVSLANLESKWLSTCGHDAILRRRPFGDGSSWKVEVGRPDDGSSGCAADQQPQRAVFDYI
jgi:hypothetical protein